MTTIVYEVSKTTHWKTLHANKNLLLGSHNLNENEEIVAEILSVEIEEIRNTSGQIEKLPILQFTNAPPMVLNITNSRSLALLYGEYYDNWVGKKIQIFSTKVKGFGGGKVDGLRIREIVPAEDSDVDHYIKQIINASSMTELKKIYEDVPKHLIKHIVKKKDEKKQELSNALN